MTQPIDTTEAVARAIYKSDGQWRDWDTEARIEAKDLYRKNARAAIETHRKKLADAGYVETPKVKLTAQQAFDYFGVHATATIEDCQRLGLPIELSDE